MRGYGLQNAVGDEFDRLIKLIDANKIELLREAHTGDENTLEILRNIVATLIHSSKIEAGLEVAHTFKIELEPSLIPAIVFTYLERNEEHLAEAYLPALKKRYDPQKSHTSSIFYDILWVYLKNSDLDSAIRFIDASSPEPLKPDLWAYIAEWHAIEGRFTEAQAILLDEAKIGPKSHPYIEYWLVERLALHMAEKGDFDGALTVTKEILNNHNRNKQQNIIAMTAAEIGRHDVAEKICDDYWQPIIQEPKAEGGSFADVGVSDLSKFFIYIWAARGMDYCIAPLLDLDIHQELRTELTDLLEMTRAAYGTDGAIIAYLRADDKSLRLKGMLLRFAMVKLPVIAADTGPQQSPTP